MTLRMPPLWRGLSARLLVLTVAFVMLAEVLIFAPSVGRFRADWLEAKLAAAHLAILALEATPDLMVSKELEAELLSHVGAYSVALSTPDRGKLMLMIETPHMVDASYDLSHAGAVTLVGDALYALFLAPPDRLIRVMGPAPRDPSLMVDIVVDERPLYHELAGYALRILGLSLVISVITAGLVYLTLHLVMVRPMRRVTESLVAFRADPEHAPIFDAPSRRGDEIGIAGRELGEMQQGLRAALSQKARLAALGTAVSKISHDLRNILSTARLVSDRMADSADPQVRRMTPTLVKSIDRAVTLCEQTLTFVRDGSPPLAPAPLLLADLAAEVGASLPASIAGQVTWMTDLPLDLTLEGDRAQLFRALSNLAQNAVQAGATRLSLTARRKPSGGIEMTLADNGPGLPPKAREHLFQPFTGSARAGGTGLGLAIAREIAQLHGGDLTLVDSSAKGTTFRIDLPGPAPGDSRAVA